MMQFLMPTVLFVASIALFVVYTNPTYQGSKGLEAQVASYDDALNKSAQLRSLREQLLSKRNTFSVEDIAKLQRILPDNVDNIRLIIDINNIAAHHNLTLANVELGEVSHSSQATSDTAVGKTGDPVGSVELGFSLTASYEDFLAFLQDLEHSLRIIDVESLNFTTSNTGASTNTYEFNIRTYWLH